MLRSILCLNQSICNSPSSFRNSNNRSVGQSLFPENGPKNFVGRSSWAQTSFQDTTILSLAWRAIGILQLLAERSSQTFQRSDIHILTLTFWLAIAMADYLTHPFCPPVGTTLFSHHHDELSPISQRIPLRDNIGISIVMLLRK